jgi:hypothetical protein
MGRVQVYRSPNAMNARSPMVLHHVHSVSPCCSRRHLGLFIFLSAEVNVSLLLSLLQVQPQRVILTLSRRKNWPASAPHVFVYPCTQSPSDPYTSSSVASTPCAESNITTGSTTGPFPASGFPLPLARRRWHDLCFVWINIATPLNISRKSHSL